MTITADMLAPLATAVTGNLATIVPVGLTIMAAIIGVSLIPKVIHKFF
jgi:hypothetical protein